MFMIFKMASDLYFLGTHKLLQIKNSEILKTTMENSHGTILWLVFCSLKKPPWNNHRTSRTMLQELSRQPYISKGLMGSTNLEPFSAVEGNQAKRCVF